MMILEGAVWEAKYELNKELPDPSKYDTEDEIALFTVLRDTIPSNPKRWRSMIPELHGVSEETTTGVHRLYKIAEAG